MREERDPYWEWFNLPANTQVRRSDYPAMLWFYLAGRKLWDKLGISILDLEDMDPVAVEALQHLIKCEEGAESNAAVVSEAEAAARAMAARM